MILLKIYVGRCQAAKEGDFYDFNFDIEPYSMRRTNPDMKAQKLMMFLQGWILPTLQIAAAQGNQIDMNIVTRDLAKYFDIESIDGWYRSAVPTDVAMNPYNPQQGQVAPGVSDGRLGLEGAASRMANLAQQQNRAGGQSSKSAIEGV